MDRKDRSRSKRKAPKGEQSPNANRHQQRPIPNPGSKPRFGDSEEGVKRSVRAPQRKFDTAYRTSPNQETKILQETDDEKYLGPLYSPFQHLDYDKKMSPKPSADEESSMLDSSIQSSDSSGAETLDMVLAKRYTSTEYGFEAHPVSASSEEKYEAHNSEKRPGNILVDDHIAGLVCDMIDEENQKHLLYSNTSPPVNRTDVDDFSADTSTLMPPPPSPLQQQPHISQPGAFRMSRLGMRPTDTDSLISGSTISQRTPRVIEAEPVQDRIPKDEESDDDEYPRPTRNFDFTTSMGTNVTNITAVTTRTSSPVIEAKPIDENQTIRAFFRRKKVQAVVCFLLSFFLILIGGTIVFGFGLFVDNSDNLMKSTAPTGSPTSTGDLDLEYFSQVALPENTRQSLKKENSPQSKALAWLRNNTFLSTYGLPKRLQRFALATFYYSTGGERRWINKEGWLTDEDECTWYSDIQTNLTMCNDGHYTFLSIGNNQLRGTMPDELNLLSSLEVLDVSENILTGFIPSTLKALTALRELRLYDNYLSGRVPDMSGMDSLEIFDIEFNFIAQVLPETIGDLGKLKHLLLDRNLLVGNVPSQLSRLTNLEVLYMFENAFSGTLPSEMGEMSSLTNFVAYENYLSGTIPVDLFRLQGLKTINLGNNTLNGKLPSEIGRLEKLEMIDIFKNELSGSLPSEIGKLTNARAIYLERNMLVGDLPTEIGSLLACETLWLYNNSFKGFLPSEIGKISELADLDLSQNSLSGSLPSEIGLLTNMEALDLHSNFFSGKIPTELGRLTKLTRLALDDNVFTGTVPDEICQLVEGGALEMTVDCEIVACSCCKNCAVSQLNHN